MSEPTPPSVPPGWSSQQPPPYGAVPPPPPAPPTTPVTSDASGAGGWGAPAWAPLPQAPKPGVVPLRPLTVLEILDGAITTMRRYPKPMFGLSFVVTAVLALFGFVVSALSIGSLTSLNDMDPNTVDAGDVFVALGPFFAGALVSGVVQAIALILLTGVLTVVVGQAVLGRDMGVGDAWTAVRPLAWRLIGLSLLLALVIGLGFLLCIVPGVIFWVFLALAGAALVLEKSKVTTAMGRSWTLVSGSWWRTFGILVLVYVIYTIITTAVSAPFSIVSVVVPPIDAAGNVNEGWFLLGQGVSAIGSIVAGTIGYPFVAASIALLYVDRRMRREGLDLQLAQAAADS